MKKRKNKIHDYSQCIQGRDYILEPIEEGRKCYMTGQGKGISQGDYLILSDGRNSYRYQVEEIDYYSNLPSMWMALIQQVKVD